jgi:hypothetical protein
LKNPDNSADAKGSSENKGGSSNNAANSSSSSSSNNDDDDDGDNNATATGDAKRSSSSSSHMLSVSSINDEKKHGSGNKKKPLNKKDTHFVVRCLPTGEMGQLLINHVRVGTVGRARYRRGEVQASMLHGTTVICVQGSAVNDTLSLVSMLSDFWTQGFDPLRMHIDVKTLGTALTHLHLAMSIRHAEDGYLIPWLERMQRKLGKKRFSLSLHLNDKKNTEWRGARGYFDAAYFASLRETLGSIDSVLVCGSANFKSACRHAVSTADLGVVCHFV